MNDMERRKFEDSFQEAFKDAEVNPSERVWTNIELDLERAEGDKMKRRIIFFKMLAAASVVFALSIAGIGYYIFKDSYNAENIAHQTDSNVNTEEKVLEAEKNSAGQNKKIDEAQIAQDDIDRSDKRLSDPNIADKATQTLKGSSASDNTSPSLALEEEEVNTSTKSTLKNQDQRNQNTIASDDKSIAANPDSQIAKTQAAEQNPSDFAEKNTSTNTIAKTGNGKKDNSIEQNLNSIALTEKNPTELNSSAESRVTSERKLPLFYQPKTPTLQLPVSNADPGMLLLARLAEEERRYAMEEKSEKKNKSEKLWTSVGFAAGGFNANNPSFSPTQSSALYLVNNSNNAATKQSNASGLAYSVGVSVGTRLSDRWVLQGGVNYLTQSSDYTANSVVVVDNNFESPKAESLNAFSPLIADASRQTTVAQTFPYNVNNNVRFVSVPVQAGYLVINRKFGLQVNAGVSTDLFLQNTITPDGGGLTKTTQGRGDDSPYRSLNFSGLMGTELSYKLGYHYRISLNPGLRYPFNSVYKSSTGVNATPLTLDVGLRFRYIFH